MKRSGLILGIMLVLFFGVLAVSYGFNLLGFPSASSEHGISYDSEVCIFKNNELVECKSNVLYTDGGNAIKSILGNPGGSGNNSIFNVISLCNSSTAGVSCGGVTAGQSESYRLFSNSGLANKTGTYFSNGNGNWTISATFTATASSLTTNVTKLGNVTNFNLSGNSFTEVTLQT